MIQQTVLLLCCRSWQGCLLDPLPCGATPLRPPRIPRRGRPADVYALGACLFSFVFGRIPFRHVAVGGCS